MTRRGAVHTIDAFFAALIIASALLYASQIPRDRDYREDGGLGARGLEALLRLDCNGTLGRLVGEGSWDEIEGSLRLALPTGVSFNLTVFDEEGNALNDVQISNGGLLGRTIESVEFLLATESEECQMYRLRLQLGGR